MKSVVSVLSCRAKVSALYVRHISSSMKSIVSVLSCRAIVLLSDSVLSKSQIFLGSVFSIYL